MGKGNGVVPIWILFGLCLYRFSHRIIWLEVEITNNHPAVIAHYFLKSVEQLGGNSEEEGARSSEYISSNFDTLYVAIPGYNSII